MKRPISLGLAPNLEKKDALSALSLITRPWTYRNGDAVKRLSEWFQTYYGVSYAYSFSSARGGMYALFSALGLKKGDEVIMQAFTCKAVVEPILAAGLIPVYADINKDFTFVQEDVLRKITKRTKAVIFQHTFGIANSNTKLMDMLAKKQIFVIEDVAHGIGLEEKKKKLGTLGDAAIFSFGRDKAFSSVSGGMVITKREDVGERLKAFYYSQKYPSLFWIFQQLFHSVSFYFLVLPFYDTVNIGKIFLVLFQKLHLLSLPVSSKQEDSFAQYYKKLPNALASQVNLQLSRLEEFNKKREQASAFYTQLFASSHLPYDTFAGKLLRYPLFVNSPKNARNYFRKHGTIYLGDWYGNIIDPKGTDLVSVGYTKGSCPQAENMAAHIVNLPTYPTLSKTDLEKVGMILKAYGKSERNND